MKPSVPIVAALLAAGCEHGCQDPFAQRRSGWQLTDFNTHQILERPDDTRERVVYDTNGDGRIDAVTLYGPDGYPVQIEADLDRDGDIDLWQYVDAHGRVEKTAASLRDNGRPDEWRYADPAGRLVMRDLDRDGDGEADWRELYRDGKVAQAGPPAGPPVRPMEPPAVRPTPRPKKPEAGPRPGRLRKRDR